jgi:putative DNA modification/repair radical SAM protein
LVDVSTKLALLADSAKYDASCASSGARRPAVKDGLGHSDGTGICHSYTPDGRCVSLLKILLTNFCVYDCLFCVNRVSSDIPRARFTPQEVVDLTLDFYRRNYIEGLFLSSGIFGSPDATMEAMVRVARTLREEHRFGGYIHLKAIPGASPELIAEAGRWADRLSANIELPTPADLAALAPEKDVAIIETTMAEIRTRSDDAADARKNKRDAEPDRFAPAGQTTQMVVGATPSTDREILTTASGLYESHALRRIYYSAFSPFPKADERLPIEKPQLVREHRLYQADWLMRFYGFRAEELTSSEAPQLSLERDPKMSWALRHPEFFPVDVNTASKEELLRVPGIGYRNVARILTIRRHRSLTFDDLRKLRVAITRVAAFVITADRSSLARAENEPERVKPAAQLSLFAGDFSHVTGEL